MNNLLLAETPKPPYYAVIFSSIKHNPAEGYDAMADQMFELATQQEGYLGFESAREEIGITVSYWSSLTAIKNWKADSQHLVAQKYGREHWYAHYKVRICLVEHDYEF
ncbi:antibiotic biosynthesis monooxygenase family protein [Mucilaginibacter sp. AW1-3]